MSGKAPVGVRRLIAGIRGMETLEKCAHIMAVHRLTEVFETRLNVHGMCACEHGHLLLMRT
jgi:hypothetical protein